MPGFANGPLRVLPSNPIYFTSDGVAPVCLSGAHTWANLQDFGGSSPNFPFELDLSRISGTLWWRTLSPRTAETTSGPTSVDGGSRQAFRRPPGAGRWVLILSRDQDPTWRARP